MTRDHGREEQSDEQDSGEDDAYVAGELATVRVPDGRTAELRWQGKRMMHWKLRTHNCGSDMPLVFPLVFSQNPRPSFVDTLECGPPQEKGVVTHWAWQIGRAGVGTL